MSIARLCDMLESHEMAAEVNVASDLRVAINIVQTHAAVRELATKIKEPGLTGRILRRTLELTEQATDVRYENPNDTALLVYTWLLYQHDAFLSYVASAAISQVPNLWWASKFANHVLEHRLTQNSMAGDVWEPVPVNLNAGDRLVVVNTRLFFPSSRHLLGPSRVLNLLESSGEDTFVVCNGPIMRMPNYGAAELELETISL